jgi:cytochrome oxidase Cu insertion factor (SCO1/SenC/PrrC family)
MKQPLHLAWLLLVSLLPLGALAQSTSQTDFAWAPHFNTGDRFPAANLTDHTGQAVNLADLSGERGYLIAFNRSVVW